MRTRLKEAAQAAILEAAEQVIGDQGIDAGMEAIAARAGVAVGTLYNHFADRHALVEALMDARRDSLVTRVERAVEASAGLGFEQQLLAVLAVFADVSGAHARFRKSLLDAGLTPHLNRRHEAKKRIKPAFASLFAHGVKEGVLRPGDHALHGAQLMGLFRATFDFALDHPDALPLQQVPRAVVDTFLHGVSKRARP